MQEINTLVKDREKERVLLARADNLNDFGTLTSLGVSALYITESLLNKEIHPSVSKFSLAVVAVGMGAVISSFAIRRHAGKLAARDEKWVNKEIADPQGGMSR